MPEIIPNLWFDRDALDAATLYTEVLGGELGGITRYPEEGLPDFQRDRAGEPVTVEFTIRGLSFIGINGGPDMPRSPALSSMVHIDPAEDPDGEAGIDRAWSRLAEGGDVLTALFPDSAEGTRVPYPEQTGPASAGSLMFSDFRLAGQWFTAMDSGIEQDEPFTPAASLAVTCADQEEIDRFWASLSTRPEAERCGWCEDAFGISWQIVPARMAELLAIPGAYERMMAMGKLSIAGLRGD